MDKLLFINLFFGWGEKILTYILFLNFGSGGELNPIMREYMPNSLFLAFCVLPILLLVLRSKIFDEHKLLANICLGILAIAHAIVFFNNLFCFFLLFLFGH